MTKQEAQPHHEFADEMERQSIALREIRSQLTKISERLDAIPISLATMELRMKWLERVVYGAMGLMLVSQGNRLLSALSS